MSDVYYYTSIADETREQHFVALCFFSSLHLSHSVSIPYCTAIQSAVQNSANKLKKK